jgi:hypothetical protein
MEFTDFGMLRIHERQKLNISIFDQNFLRKLSDSRNQEFNWSAELLNTTEHYQTLIRNIAEHYQTLLKSKNRDYFKKMH